MNQNRFLHKNSTAKRGTCGKPIPSTYFSTQLMMYHNRSMMLTFKLHKLCVGTARPIVRMLSANAESNVSMTPSTTRRRRTLDPIIITESAAQRLQELLERNPSKPIGIRLGTKKRGCNGLSYTLNYVTEISQKDEPMTTSNGVRVFIEPMALMNVVGTKMDWVETELSAEFTFTNPNSKGECGCGESFNV
jgi:iron-sulfur cluster assembly accessory protein